MQHMSNNIATELML